MISFFYCWQNLVELTSNQHKDCQIIIQHFCLSCKELCLQAAFMKDNLCDNGESIQMNELTEKQTLNTLSNLNDISPSEDNTDDSSDGEKDIAHMEDDSKIDVKSEWPPPSSPDMFQDSQLFNNESC